MAFERIEVFQWLILCVVAKLETYDNNHLYFYTSLNFIKQVLQFPRAAVIKTRDQATWNKIFLSHSSGVYKFKIKMSVGLGPSESSEENLLSPGDYQ